jgi:hypothetical protein
MMQHHMANCHDGESSLITLNGLGLEDGTVLPCEALVKEGKMKELDASRAWALHMDAMLLRPDLATFGSLAGKNSVEAHPATFMLSEEMEDSRVLQNVPTGRFCCLAVMTAPGLWGQSLEICFMVCKKIDGSYYRVGLGHVEVPGQPTLEGARDWALERSDMCSIRLA